MTRKTHKGIVGKEMPTVNKRYEVGEGIGFKDQNLTSTDEIVDAIKDRNDRKK